MHIHNTAHYFKEQYEPTIAFLEKYYDTFSDSFEHFTFPITSYD